MEKVEPKRWENASWEGTERTRRAADVRLSFRQKVEWNAQAIKLAEQLKLDKRR